MKNNVDSKLLLGLLVGAAVGAAIGYLAATDKKEQILDELNSFVGKVKDGLNSAVNKYKCKIENKVDGIVEDLENV
ncbi:MAG: YtxH domain-containing protein [Tannerella sp.]|jgi:gas vesicle protein|nr:YtxH domain-containing protein [Tannerella sp.]